MGREAVLREVVSLVHAHRLVTIAGAAGAGKTQTALQSAVFLREADAWDVRYAGLAAIGDTALVPAAIASAAGLNDVPHAPLGDALLAFVSGKKLLLVVDDCEGIASGVAEFLSTILAATTDVRVIAACREPLGIPGEQVYRLPPLSHGRACALFTERSASDRAFDPTAKRRRSPASAAVSTVLRERSSWPLRVPTRCRSKPSDRASKNRFRALRCPRRDRKRCALRWSGVMPCSTISNARSSGGSAFSPDPSISRPSSRSAPAESTRSRCAARFRFSRTWGSCTASRQRSAFAFFNRRVSSPPND